jgi:hypothetical protein
MCSHQINATNSSMKASNWSRIYLSCRPKGPLNCFERPPELLGYRLHLIHVPRFGKRLHGSSQIDGARDTPSEAGAFEVMCRGFQASRGTSLFVRLAFPVRIR